MPELLRLVKSRVVNRSTIKLEEHVKNSNSETGENLRLEYRLDINSNGHLVIEKQLFMSQKSTSWFGRYRLIIAPKEDRFQVSLKTCNRLTQEWIDCESNEHNEMIKNTIIASLIQQLSASD